MKIQIQQVPIGLRQTADSIELFQGGYELGSNESCTVRVDYFSGSDLKTQEKIIIPQELVENWTDDQPIIDWVMNELDLIKIEIKPW